MLHIIIVFNSREINGKIHGALQKKVSVTRSPFGAQTTSARAFDAGLLWSGVEQMIQYVCKGAQLKQQQHRFITAEKNALKLVRFVMDILNFIWLYSKHKN